MKNKVDFAKFDNSWYSTDRSITVRIIWMLVSSVIFKSNFFPFYGVKTFLLRIFGASIGDNFVIKPCVNIKYPWKLHIGDHVWIGERVWIDNLAPVFIKNNVCLSQGALLITGNHDYKKISFDLKICQIHLEDGVWIGAGSIVGPGVVCRNNSVLCLGSVATKEMSENSIYQGNPAIKIKDRF